MAMSYNYCRQTKYITKTQPYVIRNYPVAIYSTSSYTHLECMLLQNYIM